MSKIEIFCDLDGVLYNFDARLAEITGSEIPLDKMSSEQKREAWKLIGSYSRRQLFWSQMELYPRAQELVDYIKTYSGTILTAMGWAGFPLLEKSSAIQHNFGSIPTILVNRGVDKARFALPNRILIDDRQVVIDSWVAAGGIGFLHTDMDTTLVELPALVNRLSGAV